MIVQDTRCCWLCLMVVEVCPHLLVCLRGISRSHSWLATSTSNYDEVFHSVRFHEIPISHKDNVPDTLAQSTSFHNRDSGDTGSGRGVIELFTISMRKSEPAGTQFHGTN